MIIVNGASFYSCPCRQTIMSVMVSTVAANDWETPDEPVVHVHCQHCGSILQIVNPRIV